MIGSNVARRDRGPRAGAACAARRLTLYVRISPQADVRYCASISTRPLCPFGFDDERTLRWNANVGTGYWLGWHLIARNSMAHDILIRGGLLLDGTGAAGRLGDLAIRDGRIAAIGTDLGDDAAKVIDATGLAVAPGFIDIKTHSDFTLPINPKAESKVRQA